MTTHSKIKLFLLSGGSLVGRNILDMLAERRQAVKLIATNSETASPTLYEFDTVYHTATTLGNSDKFEQQLLQIIKVEEPDLILPCRDDDLIFLADLKERNSILSEKIVSGNSRTAKAMYDKFKSWEFAREYDLPFAPTAPTSSKRLLFELADKYGFPLLAKPRVGFASRGVFIINNKRQLSAISEKENYIVQKFLGDAKKIHSYLDEVKNTGLPLHHTFEGIKHSIQIWISKDGKPAGWFCSKNVNQRGTSIRLEKYDGNDAKELAQKCLEVFSEAGWTGPVNIQCQKTPEGELYIYEFNGRISGASAARYLMGFDEMNHLTQLFLERELPSKTNLNNRKVLRYLVDSVVPGEAQSELERNDIWKTL